MARLYDIYNSLNAAFPFNTAESWDNSGILVENNEDITKITVALDASVSVVNEAAQNGSQLIVTHHPVIFHPIKMLSKESPAVIAAAKSIAIISAHTNYDVGYSSADSLFSEKLSEEIGFREDGILEITHSDPHPIGFGRTGRLNKPMSSDELSEKIKAILNCDSLRYTKKEGPIHKLAFCCGGAADLMENAILWGCDAYITSDVKHSTFIDANNRNICLITPTHYQMEKPAMKKMADTLKYSFPDIEVIESEFEKEPSKII